MWICATCGNSYAAAPSPPDQCRICADERQWVPRDGQPWTTPEELAAAGHRTALSQVEPGLHSLRVKPGVGIGQRGLLVTTDGGNLLWDPPGYLDEAAIAAVTAAGGLAAVSASHPHFYGAMTTWAAQFDAQVLVPDADRHWVTNPGTADLRTWGDTASVAPGVTLVQCGGHFPGSAVVHWAAGADGAGVLLTGDTIFVTPGADRTTFAWSAPNRLPLPERAVRQIVAAVEPYAFDRIYDAWTVLRADAKQVLAASAQRYIDILRGDVDTG